MLLLTVRLTEAPERNPCGQRAASAVSASAQQNQRRDGQTLQSVLRGRSMLILRIARIAAVAKLPGFTFSMPVTKTFRISDAVTDP